MRRLLKRLGDLSREKERLVSEVEQEEEFLTNTLGKRLDALKAEKVQLELQLESEQEYITNKLQSQLDALKLEKARLVSEKSEMERSQEAVVITLQKKAERLQLERRALRREVRDLRRQVQQYADDQARLGAEKIRREIELETEEENIVNRLQKQIEDLMRQRRELERKLNVQTYAAYTSESETDVSEDEGAAADGLHRHQTHPRASSGHHHQRGFPIVSNSHSWSQPSSPSRNVAASPTSVISASPKRNQLQQQAVSRPVETAAAAAAAEVRGRSSSAPKEGTGARAPL